MNKGLEALEVSNQLKDFVLEFVKNGLDRRFVRGSFDIIETALKSYEELTSKPAILYGRHQGQTKSMIDYVCKNWKEVKITNLEDEKKLKALNIIKEKEVDVNWLKTSPNLSRYNLAVGTNQALKKEEFDLLKEMLL